MFIPLLIRSFRDSFVLLVCCCALMFGFIWIRLWIVSQIDFQEAIGMFAKVIPEFIHKLLPVPIEVIATIEGRITFSYEELPVGLLIALWTVARGSECLAGRLGDGTMEMLLSQPVRRLTLVATHASVTVLGVVLISLTAWLATATGIATINFDEPTSARIYLPAAANLCCVGVFMAGAATLASAIGRSRMQAVAIFVGFYIIEITCVIVSMMVSDYSWLGWFTFLSAYDPTVLTIGLQAGSAEHWTMFWQYNGLLLGLSVLTFALSATVFCHRDVPAPL